MQSFSWECLYCSKSQIVTESNFSEGSVVFQNALKSKYGLVGHVVSMIVCSNPECKEVVIRGSLHKYNYNPHGADYIGNELESWLLRPSSIAKIFPDYIPEQLRNDYLEACKIRMLSPKASATLSRRCIQGMIRDFCQISRKTLNQEILDLRKLADEDSLPKGVQMEHIEAIDHVRAIGNIGAHFEQDINFIIDVEPDEAEQLIGLIEMLFDEWYVASYKRQMRLAGLKSTREDKDKMKDESKKATSK